MVVISQMPIFAKYLVVFENRNRDSRVVCAFYKREATNGEITPNPNPAIKRMAVAQIPVEEYSKFNNYSVEGLEKKAKRQATSRGNKAIGALFRKATAFPFPIMQCCERAYFYGR